MTPLVLVVGADSAARHASEAVLAKLRFAVAISETPRAALEGMTSLRPDIVVVAADDVLEMRTTAPGHVPIVVLREDPELTVEAIRWSLA